ncbi:DTW domain-containing protein 2 [Punica granatum]|uniref:tRNA-uridine aminocarboxypropyltransferase n=2 Tax=Punica granatum TaxID=22663 RepID=A0A218W3Y6_PUNGR|nr:DTW domain-containing protein 2 [Punica granatum]OWM67249.1 hypothetical protein CDL15_Pgr000701 [Punica granatum]PKI32331.1 hypothetical protein CRG98_047278 [Punica granatum]
MDPEEEAILHLPTTTAAAAGVGGDLLPAAQRRSCTACDRPLPVCLCHVLPAQPIPTATQVVILHHPHEARHKLSTVPVLSKCLLNSTILVHRRLRPGLCPLFDKSPPAIYLFPPSGSSAPSIPLSQLRSSGILGDAAAPPVIIAIDATWKHAKEMVSASEEFLSKFAVRVCLDFDYDEGVTGGSIYDSELVLRKEPYGGCVSTMEAVARALRVIEPNGVEIERELIRVLREMVRLQAQFLKPMKPRSKLLKKKGKQMEKDEVEKQESQFEVSQNKPVD